MATGIEERDESMPKTKEEREDAEVVSIISAREGGGGERRVGNHACQVQRRSRTPVLLLVLARRRYSLRIESGARQSKASVDAGGQWGEWRGYNKWCCRPCWMSALGRSEHDFETASLFDLVPEFLDPPFCEDARWDPLSVLI